MNALQYAVQRLWQYLQYSCFDGILNSSSVTVWPHLSRSRLN